MNFQKIFLNKLFVALLLIFTAIATVSAQRVRYVKQDGAGSGSSWSDASGDLQAMINASQTGDTVWVAAGTYKPSHSAAGWTPSSPTPVNTVANDPDNAFVLKEGVKVYGGFSGDETSLSGRDAATNRCILSGDVGGNTVNDNVHHVVIASGVSSATVLDGFTVSGGHAYGTGEISVNGRIFYRHSGSGVYNNAASPTLVNLIFADNASNQDGGGIYNTNGSAPLISEVEIRSNQANFGAGIYNDSLTVSSSVLRNVFIRGNHAGSGGGGIYNYKSNSPRLINAVVSGNTADKGAGIYNYHSSPTLINATFAGNKATTGGGGIYNEESSPQVYNTVIWGNTPEVFDEGGSAPVYRHSLVKGLTPVGSGNLDGTLASNDPQYMLSVTPGESTAGDYRVPILSPLIGAGSNSLYGTTVGATDLFHNPRLTGDSIDIGAYESPTGWLFNDTVYVDSAQTGNGSSWSNAYPTLADPLYYAAQNPGKIKVICVAKGTYYPMYKVGEGGEERDKAFVPVNGVTVVGGYPAGGGTRDLSTSPSILSGDLAAKGDDADNAYHVVVASGINASAILDGFVITGGKADGSGSITVNSQPVSRSNGGGISNYSSSATLRNLTVSGNSAVGNGGGIYNNMSTPSTVNMLVSGNAAQKGGGIYNTQSMPTLINVTVAGNLSDGDGSGIFNDSSSPRLYNCIVWGNSGNYGLITTSGAATSEYSLIQGINTGGSNYNGNDAASDPLFKAPLTPGQALGGDYSLSPCSPYIDAGSNSLYSGTLSSDNDLAGRLRLTGDSIDIGAYEYPASKLKATDILTDTTVAYHDTLTLLRFTGTSPWQIQYTYGDETHDTVISEPVLRFSPSATGDLAVTSVSITDGNGCALELSLNVALVVLPDTLDVTVADTIKPYGYSNPEFRLLYSGFVKGENESAVTDKPVVSTAATKDSPEGNYTVTVSGGSAANYVLRYHSGTLTISKVAATSVSLNKSETTMLVGNEETLTATIHPVIASNQDVTWTSSDPTIATVDENGAVTAVAPGTATITVTTADGGFSDECTVTVVETPVEASSVSLNKNATTITEEYTETLIATVAPTNATNQDVVWTSSDPSIATVNNGVVTAVAEGVATITVTTADGAHSDSCRVTVVAAPVAATSVSLNKGATTILVDSVETLTATILPVNASNRNLVWTSSDTSTVKVHNGVIKGIAPGTAIVTVTTDDGALADQCTVNVVANPVAVIAISLNKDATVIVTDGSETLIATILPSNATNQNVTWNSSNPAVATVNNGVVTAIAPGTANIAVTTADGNHSAYCKVTVTETPVAVGGVMLNKSVTIIMAGSDETLTATVLPSDATDRNVSWKTDDATVATVNNGVVTAVAEGVTAITVTTSDGAYSATCKVTVVPAPVPVTSVSLNKGTTNIMVGENEILTATVLPVNASNQSVTWSSSDPSIATVNNGVVTAVAPGTAIITVTTADGNCYDNCLVTVTTAPVAVTGISLNKSVTTIDEGNSETLTAVIEPVNASNQKVTWSSSDPSVAIVNSGVVTAIAPGTATITVTTEDGAHSDSCRVTVVALPIAVAGISLNKGFTYMLVDSVEILTATILPANASNQNLSWKSDNTAVATVNNGVVTAVAPGTAIITVTTEDGKYTDKCFVTVTQPDVAIAVVSVSLNKDATTITEGKNETLTATVSPDDASNQKVGWTSSDPTVATVKNGVVTAIAPGTATITVTTDDGAHTATCAVTVVSATTPTTPVVGLALNKDATTIVEGGVETLVATVFPSDATDQTLVWSSDNTAIAEVNNGVVRAIVHGTATITVATPDGTLSANCVVTVTQEEVAVDSIKLNKHETAILTGANETLVATIYPDNATNRNLIWLAGNPAVADVFKGKVTAIAAGTTTITVVTADGLLRDICTVKVSNAPVAVDSIALNEHATDIVAGESKTLTATVYPDSATNQNVTWTSSNPDVATVNGGIVTTLKDGTTTITVTTADGAYSDSCTITVRLEPVTDVEIVIDGTEWNGDAYDTINVGDSKRFEVKILPDNASNKKVTWTSSDPTIATVDVNGSVTGIAPGDAAITATSDDGALTATCYLTVIRPADSVAIDQPALTLNIDSTATVVATVYPDDATDQNVTWSSSDPTVAVVDDNGNITAVGPGTAVITATTDDGAYVDSCTVNVPSNDARLKSLLADVGAVAPAFNADTLAYTVKVVSSVTSVVLTGAPEHAAATVSGNGAVALNSIGDTTVTITVTAEDGFTTREYSVTLVRMSNDASLKSLTADFGELLPEFDPDTKDYTINVSNSVTEIELVGIANHDGATVSGNGVGALKPGSNTFTITVTSEDGTTTETYTVTVVRDGSVGGGDADLISLAANGESLVVRDTLVYAPGCGITTLSLLPVISPYASLTIDDVPFTADFLKAIGNNIIYYHLRVVSELGDTANNYVLKVIPPLHNDDLYYQRWLDVLSINMNPDNNGGYAIQSVKWYHTGSNERLSTKEYIEIDDAPSSYYAVITLKSGEEWRVCGTITIDEHAFAYPNPIVRGATLKLSIPTRFTGGKLFIYNLSGNMVKANIPLPTLNNDVNVSDIAPGIYILNVINAAGTLKDEIKIVIQ